MSRVKHVAKGVIISWACTFSSIIAGFLMAPFLVRHLGIVEYGLWILVQSTVSYMYLMDLGLRTAVIKLVARDFANTNHTKVSHIVSAALWVRFWSGAAVVAITALLAVLLPHLFAVPAEYLLTARLALFMVGATFATTLVFSLFSATLMAIGAFEKIARLELLQILLTTAGLVPVVMAGHGLLGMATWYFFAILTVNVLTTITCFRSYPELRIFFTRFPEKHLLKELWSVGLYILGFNLAGQLILYTDNLVVGAFVSAAAVAFYAVAGRMVDYTRQVALAILKYFMPVASALEAKQDFSRLEKLQIKGTQIVLLVTLPIATALFIRGNTFLTLWIGPEFGKSTPVLKVLLLAATLTLPNASAPSLGIVFNRQRYVTALTLIEGAFNLCLSITLARYMGLIGVAIGTAIPCAIMHLLFWPRFVSHMLKLKPLKLATQIWMKPAVALIPFAVATYFAERYWVPSNLIKFFLQIAALCPLIILGNAAVFWSEVPVVWHFALRQMRLEQAR
jgi:O-antigen/teichoic acid export membrane protein